MAKVKKQQPPTEVVSASRAAEADLLEQYRQAKAQYPDALLFFRLGDFYEMFYDDAAVGARELDIVLTSRPCGKGRERVPLCGVPHYRLEAYLARLVDRGYKVAICEQTERPQRGRTLIQREVVRVVTPGTLFETEGKEQTLAAMYTEKEHIGVAFLELATGEFRVAETIPSELPTLLTKFQPRELLLRDGEAFDTTLFSDTFVTTRPTSDFAVKGALGNLVRAFGREVIESLGLRHRRSLVAAHALLSYVNETQQKFVPHVKAPQPYHSENFIWLDAQTQRNLELTSTMYDGAVEGSLLSVLDRTQTRMGKRRLRYWLLHPLIAVENIGQRQDAIATLVTQVSLLAELREVLASILDLERLTSRVTAAIANPRDLSALRASLVALPRLRELLTPLADMLLHSLCEGLDPLDDMYAELRHVLVDEPRAVAKEGGLIRDAVSTELDELRAIQANGNEWLATFEQHEREQTAIPNLRVGFNRVFGYYLEVTKSYLTLVPKTYQRRQTLTNAERFVTEPLKRFEERVLSASDRSKELEYELFTRLREQVATQADRLRHTAEIVGTLDVLCSFAEVAAKKNWKRPVVTDTYGIHITEGRHPVVEVIAGSFVPNDLNLDEHTYMLLLTGPNAAGKSTYVRQCALLVILAQIGSFVPVESATIGVVDRIFTRVGAADFLARGLSTFMVEMQETANILRQATPKSLLILDEVGRGTGTSDGQAIAQAVAELLAQNLKAKTLFTTHYHELARLADAIAGIVNVRLEVREENDEVTFLYKVVPGAAQKSYGVYVAKLAGLPASVIERAREILAQRPKETSPQQVASSSNGDRQAVKATNLRGESHPVIDRLTSVDVLHTTPLEALVLLAELKKLLGGEEQ
jgi:DNA mismatch repair protein MutS